MHFRTVSEDSSISDPHKPSLTRHQVRPIRPNPSDALLSLPFFLLHLPSVAPYLILYPPPIVIPPSVSLWSERLNALLSNGPFRDSSLCCSGEEYATSSSLPNRQAGRHLSEPMLPFPSIPAFTCIKWYNRMLY